MWLCDVHAVSILPTTVNLPAEIIKTSPYCSAHNGLSRTHYNIRLTCYLGFSCPETRNNRLTFTPLPSAFPLVLSTAVCILHWVISNKNRQQALCGHRLLCWFPVLDWALTYSSHCDVSLKKKKKKLSCRFPRETVRQQKTQDTQDQ